MLLTFLVSCICFAPVPPSAQAAPVSSTATPEELNEARRLLLAPVGTILEDEPYKTRLSEATERHWSEVEVTREQHPKYPVLAKELRLEGNCSVDAFIDPSGEVFHVRPASCSEVFWEPSRDAVQQWRFKRTPGETGDIVITLSLKFRLS